MTSADGLWPWTLRTYGRVSVEALCLDLQDVHGQSIPFILWAAWMADQGRPAAAEVLIQGAGIARAWEGEVIGPLRQVRRRLRGAGVEGLRSQVKAAELEAERTLMTELEALSPASSAAVDLGDAVLSAGLVWNPATDPAALKLFASILR